MIDVGAALKEVRDIRRAARAAVQDDGQTVPERCLALLELGRRAKAAMVARFAEAALWDECREFLGHPRPVPWRPGDAIEKACRGLRSRGYQRCPNCLRDLPTDVDFDRWSVLRACEVEQTLARERAVG